MSGLVFIENPKTSINKETHKKPVIKQNKVVPIKSLGATDKKIVKRNQKFVLNADTYHSLEANKRYMSVSQFKAFNNECEAKEMAILNGEYTEGDKDPFLLGGYVHAWNEGKLQEYIRRNPQMFKENGEMYKKFEIGDKMINALRNDKLIETAREGQKEVIMTAELFGVQWKCMIDIYNPEKKIIADLKTTRELHKKYWNEEYREKQNFIEYYDYLLQMAVYAEIDRINRGADEYFHPHIIAVDKQDIPDKAIIYLGQNFIEDKLLEVEDKIERIIRVKNGELKPERCEKCDYCRSTKQLTEVIHYTEL